MRAPPQHWLAALFVVTALGAASDGAFACACCTSAGERTDLIMRISSSHVAELRQLRFDKTAALFLGEADPESIKGIATPAEKYDVQAAWQNERLVLTFRDPAGRVGTLSLLQPNEMSIFHVDPRNQPDRGLGPALYKEWRLTSNAMGTGIFTPGMAPRQSLTLVLQGQGNNCTSVNDFTHWMLIMRGPKAQYHFFGSLVTTP